MSLSKLQSWQYQVIHDNCWSACPVVWSNKVEGFHETVTVWEFEVRQKVQIELSLYPEMK